MAGKKLSVFEQMGDGSVAKVPICCPQNSAIGLLFGCDCMSCVITSFRSLAIELVVFYLC
jgi:hypothetical protein